MDTLQYGRYPGEVTGMTAFARFSSRLDVTVSRALAGVST